MQAVIAGKCVEEMKLTALKSQFTMQDISDNKLKKNRYYTWLKVRDAMVFLLVFVPK